MMGANCKTKKLLKEKIGTAHRIEETSMFGPEFKPTGKFAVVGPSAYVRNWYATLTYENGILKKVV